MSKYTFILRKKQIEIELSSTEPAFITKQMKIWQAVLMPGVANIAPAKRIIQEPESEISHYDSSTETEIYETLKESEKVLKELETQSDESSIPAALHSDLDDILHNNSIESFDTVLDHMEEPEGSCEELVVKSSDLLNEFEYETTQDDAIQEIEKSLSDLLSEESASVEPDISQPVLDHTVPSVKENGQSDLGEEVSLIDYEISEESISASSLLEEPEKDSGVLETEQEPDLSEINTLLSEFETGGMAEDYTDSMEISLGQPDKVDLTDFLDDEIKNASEGIKLDITAQEEVNKTPGMQIPPVEEQQVPKEILEEDLDSVLSEMFTEIEEGEEVTSHTEVEAQDLTEPAITVQEDKTEFEDNSEDDIDSVLSEMLSEIEEVEAEAEPSVADPAEEVQQTTAVQESISEPVIQEDDLLQAFMDEPAQEIQPEPVPIVEPQPKFLSYENYITSVTLKVPIDLLIATANYLDSYESKKKFTTKDVSAKTMETFKRPVSPNTVLAAVNKGLIEVVPDFTGTAESNEYIITQAGYTYIKNNLPYVQE